MPFIVDLSSASQMQKLLQSIGNKTAVSFKLFHTSFLNKKIKEEHCKQCRLITLFGQTNPFYPYAYRWMDGGKDCLNVRGLTIQEAEECVKDRRYRAETYCREEM